MSTKATKEALARFEVKATDDDSLTFEGLASTWELDLGGDVIHPGAFKRTLDRWRESQKVVPLIDQHNYGSVRAVVGKMVEAEERAEGLWTRWEILDSDDGREVYKRIKGGFVDGLSIGYRVIGEPEVQNGVRHIREVALEEVSVVIWPMNQGARIQAVKAATEHLNDEEKNELRALLEPPKEEPQGLAPDDPARLEAESLFREVTVRSLATR
jgi:HK97 family phage prohead protease